MSEPLQSITVTVAEPSWFQVERLNSLVGGGLLESDIVEVTIQINDRRDGLRTVRQLPREDFESRFSVWMRYIIEEIEQTMKKAREGA